MNGEQLTFIDPFRPESCRECVLETMAKTVDWLFNDVLKDYGAFYKGTKEDLLRELRLKL